MVKDWIPPRFLLWLWPAIDSFLRKVYHLTPLRGSNSILCLKLRCYHGHPISLGDGSEVKSGDRIIELHLNSAWFKEKRRLNLRTTSLPWQVLRSFARDLSLLAEQMASGKLGSAKALHGCTLLDAGAKRLGFQIEEVPDTCRKRWTRFYLAGLIQIYHLRGQQGFKVDKPWELKEAWLSRKALLEQYQRRS